MAFDEGQESQRLLGTKSYKYKGNNMPPWNTKIFFLTIRLPAATAVIFLTMHFNRIFLHWENCNLLYRSMCMCMCICNVYECFVTVKLVYHAVKLLWTLHIEKEREVIDFSATKHLAISYLQSVSVCVCVFPLMFTSQTLMLSLCLGLVHQLLYITVIVSESRVQEKDK